MNEPAKVDVTYTIAHASVRVADDMRFRVQLFREEGTRGHRLALVQTHVVEPAVLTSTYTSQVRLLLEPNLANVLGCPCAFPLSSEGVTVLCGQAVRWVERGGALRG